MQHQYLNQARSGPGPGDFYAQQGARQQGGQMGAQSLAPGYAGNGGYASGGDQNRYKQLQQPQRRGGQPIGRQSSIYSLTLDEFQAAMGESGLQQAFGSMNMDEFLRSVCSVDEREATAAAIASGADQQQVGGVPPAASG